MAAGMIFRRIGGKIVPIAKKAGAAVAGAAKKAKRKRGQIDRVSGKVRSRELSRVAKGRRKGRSIWDDVDPRFEKAGQVVTKAKRRKSNVTTGAIGLTAGALVARRKLKEKKK